MVAASSTCMGGLFASGTGGEVGEGAGKSRDDKETFTFANDDGCRWVWNFGASLLVYARGCALAQKINRYLLFRCSRPSYSVGEYIILCAC